MDNCIADIEREIAGVAHWRHCIPLPSGVVTPGSQDTLSQVRAIGIPDDLTGQTVLDIGCSDGFYSFECEQRGAARVLGVDNFSSVYVDTPSGFSVAHRLRQSKVEFQQMDLFELDPSRIGQFDLVLFLGVLYHLKHPFLAIEKVAALCRGQLIVETEIAPEPSGLRQRMASLFVGTPRSPWMDFHETDDINHDPTTWWAPSAACMEGMLRSSGFCGVKTHSSNQNRGVFHAFHPSRAGGGAALVQRCGTHPVLEAFAGELGRTDIDPARVPEFLDQLTVPEFARLKQRIAETRAKHWHQVERWNGAEHGE